jgi:ABC-type microcin C transport system permease subunit YejE
MRIKNTSLRTIALALITISLIATATIAEDRPLVREPKVIVQFNSRPDYAELYVDGEFVGSTDLALRLTPGKHVVEMRRDGYETWCRELSVTPDNSTRVVGLLKQSRGND